MMEVDVERWVSGSERFGQTGNESNDTCNSLRSAIIGMQQTTYLPVFEAEASYVSTGVISGRVSSAQRPGTDLV